MKRFLWIDLLASCSQTVLAFSLLGPDSTYTPQPQGDLWQVPDLTYSTPNGNAPYIIVDTAPFGPKNLGEGYRRNTPVMYYTFDASFGNWFGSNGEFAVQQAFDMVNNAFTTNNITGLLTNGVDSYTALLSEFPLNSQSENYSANVLGLADVKSMTLSLLMEQLGLTDAIRYVWTLHDRVATPGCTLPCPLCEVYLVVMRNYDYYLTPLGYNLPDQGQWGQYSPYVNGELYTYVLPGDNCGTPNTPFTDAVEIGPDHIINNAPVASGHGEGGLEGGFFYTGLTRDDAAGLRWLYSSNNFNTPSEGYLESSAAGSVAVSSGGAGNGPTFQLTTSSLAILSFTDPTTLQTLFPGLVITGVTTNIVNGRTNYNYTFANLVTYSFSTNTMVITQVQTTTISPNPYIGQDWPPIYFITNPPVTTTITNTLNMVSGDFYIIPTNSCGLTVLTNPPPSNIVVVVTNNLGTVTNSNPAAYTTNITSTNIITFSTNHILWVKLCTNVPGTTNGGVVGDFQGIGRVQFVRVADGAYDYMTGQFTNGMTITNQYSMVLIQNGQANTVVFQRVLTGPDIVFRAQDMEYGPNGPGYLHHNALTRNVNFNQSYEVPAGGDGTGGTAGPGTINSPSIITYNKVGPDYENDNPSTMQGPKGVAGRWFIWSSFDGTTNLPVIYPNGTSIANLSAEALIQISPPPPTLPDGTNGVPYPGGNVTNVVFSVTGGQSPYTWLLTTNSAGLPPNLALSTSGVISGKPTNSATYDGIQIQMNDSGGRSVIMDYSITIH